MAKVKIQGHASGTGILTVTAPDTDVNRTITLPDATGTLLSGAGGRRNMIINGDMRVQQRGTASVTSGYFVDRFTLSGCSASAVLTSSTPTEFPTAISITATSGNPIAGQKIESKNCQHLSGQTVIVSFYAKNISNATTLYTSLAVADNVDNFGASTTISEQNLGSLTGSWVKYTASWTVPAAGLNGLALSILCAGTSTFTMGITGVQLELGSTATDFEHRSYGEELSSCERYYHRHTANVAGAGVCAGTIYSTTAAAAAYRYPTIMRTIPTLSYSAVGDFRVLYTTTKVVTAIAGERTISGGRIWFTSSGMTAGNGMMIDANNTSCWLAFDAEL